MHEALLEVWSVQDDLIPLQHQHSRYDSWERWRLSYPSDTGGTWQKRDSILSCNPRRGVLSCLKMGLHEQQSLSLKGPFSQTGAEVWREDPRQQGTPKLGASQEVSLLMLNRLAVGEPLPSPGASGSSGVGIRGCEGKTDIAPLISTLLSVGLAGEMRALRLGGGKGQRPGSRLDLRQLAGS